MFPISFKIDQQCFSTITCNYIIEVHLLMILQVTDRTSTVICFQGYLPANIDRRQATLDRKREEYHNFVKQYYPTRYEDTYHDTFRQVQHVTDNSNLYSIHDQTPFEFSYPCQCVFSVVKFFCTGKLRVSESVTQCQKRTTQYMFFIICSTDSHRYPKNKPSHSSFSTAIGTGGKSRVSSAPTLPVLVTQIAVPMCSSRKYPHTSPMGGTHPHPTGNFFKFFWLQYRTHPTPGNSNSF